MFSMGELSVDVLPCHAVMSVNWLQVPSERNMIWSPIEVDLSTLAPSVLNGRHSGNLTIKIFRTTMDGKVGRTLTLPG